MPDYIDQMFAGEPFGSAEWDTEAWGGENIQTERERVTLSPGVVYNAHIVGVSTRDLPQKEGVATKRLVDYEIRVYAEAEDGRTVSLPRTLRSRWLTAAYNGSPADVSELVSLGVQALRDDTPRKADGKPAVDADHPIQWWVEACVGRPIRVKGKLRHYTTRDGEERATVDFYPHSAWPEGEIL